MSVSFGKLRSQEATEVLIVASEKCRSQQQPGLVPNYDLIYDFSVKSEERKMLESVGYLFLYAYSVWSKPFALGETGDQSNIF